MKSIGEYDPKEPVIWDDEEKVRCNKCGCFVKAIPFFNENSGEMIECYCKKCKIKWQESY